MEYVALKTLRSVVVRAVTRPLVSNEFSEKFSELTGETVSMSVPLVHLLTPPKLVDLLDPERERRLTRQVLEVLLRFRHPLTIVTKGSLILRDLDLLRELAEQNLVADDSDLPLSHPDIPEWFDVTGRGTYELKKHSTN